METASYHYLIFNLTLSEIYGRRCLITVNKPYYLLLLLKMKIILLSTIHVFLWKTFYEIFFCSVYFVSANILNIIISLEILILKMDWSSINGNYSIFFCIIKLTTIILLYFSDLSFNNWFHHNMKYIFSYYDVQIHIFDNYTLHLY